MGKESNQNRKGGDPANPRDPKENEVSPVASSPPPPPLNEGGDEIDELFASVDDDVRVYIYRREPLFGPRGENVGGYLGLLPQGADQDYLRNMFGGGVFQMQKRIRTGDRGSFKFDRSFTIRIAGDPIAGGHAKSPANGDNTLRESPASPKNLKTGVSTVVDVTGVEFETDDPLFFQNLNKAIILKGMFATPPAAPATDVKSILEVFKMGFETARGGSDRATLADRLDEIKAIRELSAELAPGDGGDGLSLGSLVKDLLPVLVAGSLQPKKAAPAVPIAGPARPQLTEHTEREEGEEVAKVEPNMLAMLLDKAGQMIKAGFLLEPPKEPERIANLMLMLHRPGDETRNYIQNKRNEIFDMLELDLVDDFTDDEGGKSRADFVKYFDTIVDAYLKVA